jgi:low affinity Fe/Cu permease
VKLDEALKPTEGLSSGRFFRTGYLPTYAGAVYLLVLLWAGAPGKHVDFGHAWQVVDKLGVAQTLLIVLGVTLTAVVLQPLQLSVVRVLEGGFPWWLGSGLGRRFQRWRKHRLEGKLAEKVRQAAGQQGDGRDANVQEAGALSARLRSRFPTPDHLVRATGLGNALAAMEDNAGRAYGLDAVVTWPRLYPLLADNVRAMLDDLRDGLDAAARLAATGAVTSLAAVALLAWHSGLLTLLALIPLAVAALAYTGGVRAAVAYGEAVHVAFDLHRFDLLTTLHLKIPAKQDEELTENIALSDFLRQRIPLPFDYAAPLPSTGTGKSEGTK